MAKQASITLSREHRENDGENAKGSRNNKPATKSEDEPTICTQASCGRPCSRVSDLPTSTAIIKGLSTVHIFSASWIELSSVKY